MGGDLIYKHTPVLVNEVLGYIPFKDDIVIIDCNLGEGGHSSKIAEILKNYKNTKIIGIERDKKIFEFAKRNLADFQDIVSLYNENFINLENILKKEALKNVNVILFDLGISAYHYIDDNRGFSFLKNDPLDMRLDKTCNFSAYEILNTFEEKKIAEIIIKYGEEHFGSKIAKNIVNYRKKKSIQNTFELVNIIKTAIPRKFWPKKISPATKTFQALRIFINEELFNLEKVLPQALNFLKKGGRLIIITFHSLEDRIVKNFFREQNKKCICPADFPVCKCNKVQTLNILTKKAIVPSQNEIKKNPASRSAKLRVAEKII